jgi:hypothetical protein
MKAKTVRELNAMAGRLGAEGWTLVRAAKHLIVDWNFADGTVRQVMANSASDRRSLANIESSVRRSRRS